MNLWHDVRALNMTANGLVAAALLALVASALAWAARHPVFELSTVVVDGAQEAPLRRVTPALLRSAGADRVDGSFFTVDLAEVRQIFEQVPWVRQAHVRRVWPNQLHVSLEEHQPLATWGDGQLVNDRGEVFSANVAEAEEDGPLLEFSGPAGTEQQVLRRWQELSRQLAPLQVRPQALSLSARYAWTARLDNGVTLLLGREQGVALDERIDRWVALYPQVHSRLVQTPVAVDLRYPHGFVVRAPAAIEGSANASRDKKTKRTRTQ